MKIWLGGVLAQWRMWGITWRTKDKWWFVGISREAPFNIPKKFKGKDVGEIIAIYKDAEKESGRRSNEIGELRNEASVMGKDHVPHCPRPRAGLGQADRRSRFSKHCGEVIEA